MTAPPDQVNSVPPRSEEEEDIILLTEVVEEPPGEVVLVLAPDQQELDSLALRESAPPESPPATPAPAAGDEDLNDFLASLKDLPEDLGTPAIAAAAHEPLVPQESPARPGELEEAVRRQLASSFSEDQLKEIVREVVQETVEKLSQELVPKIAAQVMDQKIAALLKRLAEEK
jgi:hypothetical protein